ncbi:DUF4134 domain-containing protein [Chitinophaga sp. ysch24]|uniref:DUF4134 domain-containing protein n=2 Tax=Chitinophaga tropicalis TaxID=2683588 RepID=A0A7K1U129_9BACT|nr:DUF4134 domain-containing protein [Chitinophaga tropicalis]
MYSEDQAKCAWTVARLSKITLLTTVALLTLIYNCQAQDGEEGIRQATQKITGYFEVGIYLMYAIGAVAGIVGAVKTFNKWNSGDPDTTKTASAWFGSCIFLVVVATVLRAMFGL